MTSDAFILCFHGYQHVLMIMDQHVCLYLLLNKKGEVSRFYSFKQLYNYLENITYVKSICTQHGRNQYHD